MNPSSAVISKSCFDTAYPIRNYFWSKLENPTQRESAMHEGSLYVDGTDTHNIYNVTLNGQYLYCYQHDSKDIVKMIKLDFQRTELIEIDRQGVIWFALKLKSSGSQAFLLSQEKVVIAKWHKCLRGFVINHDFSKKYDMKELIGEGSFSKVYKIAQKRTKKIYAAKIIEHSKIFEEGDSIEKLVCQEIEILRKLDHPSIPKLVEVHEVDSKVILVMEYFSGVHLDETFTKDLSQSDILMITLNLVKVIDHLREVGIVHRDIKPQNFLFNRETQYDGIRVGLIDFGLSAYSSLRPMYTNCGTLGYVAPETLKTKFYQQIAADHKSDMFCIGIILYELVYGQNPFIQDDAPRTDVVYRRNAQARIDLQDFDKRGDLVNQDLRTMLKSLLKQKPEERPRSDELLFKFSSLQGIMVKGKNEFSEFSEDTTNSLSSAKVYTFKVKQSKFKSNSVKTSSSEEIETNSSTFKELTTTFEYKSSSNSTTKSQ